MKKYIMIISIIFLSNMLIGCHLHKQLEKEKTDKVYIYSDTPCSLEAIVQKKLGKGRMQVRVIDSLGSYKKGDEVIVEYESVSVKQSTDEKIRNIKIEDFDFVPEIDTKVLITYWDKEIKKEKEQHIVVSNSVCAEDDEIIEKVINEIKIRVDKITITYGENEEQKRENIKTIKDKNQINEILKKINEAYAVWQVTDYDKSRAGYLLQIYVGDNEVGSVRFSDNGVCELLIRELLPWDMNCYEIEKELYQWVKKLYQTI